MENNKIEKIISFASSEADEILFSLKVENYDEEFKGKVLDALKQHQEKKGEEQIKSIVETLTEQGYVLKEADIEIEVI